jgi:hypothetical protein
MKLKAAATAALVIGALTAPAAAAAPQDQQHSVLELRQYKIVAGKRDAFVDLFDKRFVESQEDLGMRLVGQFRDRDDPTRFTWIRSFQSMDLRGKGLNDFYFGPVWQAYRGEANPMLDDNDDVLLLKPAWDGAEFAPAQGTRPQPGAAAPPAGTVVTTIEHLWKDPEEGYSAFFRDRLAPAYKAAGLPVLAAYVAENQTNNFPRLYVRQNERVLVWFTRVERPEDYASALKKLSSSKSWRESLGPALRDYLERPPRTLFLQPTPRSLLR